MSKIELLDKDIVSLYDKLQIGIYIIDSHCTVLYVNDYFVKLCGKSKQAFIGVNFLDHKNTYTGSLIERVVKTGQMCSAFQDVNFYDKSYRQLVTEIPVFDEDGSVKYIIAMIERVEDHAKRLEDASRNEIHLSYFHRTSDSTKPNVSIIAESPQMQELLKLIEIVAPVYSSVLIEGESGTGKELIVQLIHEKSKRGNKPLVAINCASLPEPLLEAELFGYEKGAFTGAREKGKKGLLTEADGGTLFLDEINSMPLSIQGKLLRVLETKKLRPLGSTKEIDVNFRVVCATNVKLKSLCEKGEFRDDLYYRLNVVPIEIPPLRNRREDIIPLAKFYLSQYETIYNKLINLSNQAFDQLYNYSWPGNIRELKNLIERIVVMNYSGTVQKIPDGILSGEQEMMPQKIIPRMNDLDIHSEILSNEFDLSKYLDSKEEEVLRWCAEHFNTMSEIAEAMKIDRTSVGRKLKKYGISMAKSNQ